LEYVVGSHVHARAKHSGGGLETRFVAKQVIVLLKFFAASCMVWVAPLANRSQPVSARLNSATAEDT
jgi:hypothetical protein